MTTTKDNYNIDPTVLELPHTIVGAVIAAKVGNPALSLPLALASHFVTDALVPHWNPHLNREKGVHGKITNKTTLLIIGDTLLSLVAGFLIASTVLPNTNHFMIVILGAFFAVLPDVVEAPYFFLNWNNPTFSKFLKFHSQIQMSVDNIPIGIATQVLVVFVFLFWLFS